jgi:exodeoxyribonuclease VII large subunit
MAADCTALVRRLSAAVQRQLSAAGSSLEILKLSLKDPALLIERFLLRVDDLQGRSASALSGQLQSDRQRTAAAMEALVLNSPLQRIGKDRDVLQNVSLRSVAAIRTCLETAGSAVAVCAGRLESLSPLAVLARGYILARKLPQRLTVRKACQLAAGDRVELQFSDGTACCDVSAVNAAAPYNLDSQPPRN